MTARISDAEFASGPDWLILGADNAVLSLLSGGLDLPNALTLSRALMLLSDHGNVLRHSIVWGGPEWEYSVYGAARGRSPFGIPRRLGGESGLLAYIELNTMINEGLVMPSDVETSIMLRNLTVYASKDESLLYFMAFIATHDGAGTLGHPQCSEVLNIGLRCIGLEGMRRLGVDTVAVLKSKLQSRRESVAQDVTLITLLAHVINEGTETYAELVHGDYGGILTGIFLFGLTMDITVGLPVGSLVLLLEMLDKNKGKEVVSLLSYGIVSNSGIKAEHAILYAALVAGHKGAVEAAVDRLAAAVDRSGLRSVLVQPHNKSSAFERTLLSSEYEGAAADRIVYFLSSYRHSELKKHLIDNLVCLAEPDTVFAKNFRALAEAAGGLVVPGIVVRPDGSATVQAP